jgi:phosphatidylserine decarboxylase
LHDLLRNDELVNLYKDGTCLVFRLCVNHYHRYSYFDNGVKGNNKFIKGRLHTVRPIALGRYPVFVQNCREMTVMETEHFGKAIQLEVGALLVGKIANLHESGPIKRGEEKGMFLYGGSTVVVLLQKDAATLPQELYDATNQGLETPVRMGQQIGE